MKWAVSKSEPTLLVSESGRVVRMASSRRLHTKWVLMPEMELSQRLIGAGYLAVNIKSKGKQKTLYVHRLVAEAFISKTKDTGEVNHIDGDKQNNNVSNLEWTTHSKNLQHAYELGLATRSSLNPWTVRAARHLLQQGLSQAEIARRMAVSRQIVSRLARGVSWSWLD